RWPYYRNLPPSLKTLGIVMVVIPSFIISAETAGRRFEQEDWQAWEKMPLSEKVIDFTARHQYSVIAGCWAVGIAGAFGAIMRNPCVVQARMWSQGLTIGVVIAAAAVTRTRMYRRDEGDVERPVNRDHSWQERI
ncbi:hypothetical protein B0F90DRAFT_1685342, partial [Multifurca ochricompacta]